MELIFLNSSDLLEHLTMLKTSRPVKLITENFLNKAIGIINFVKRFSKFDCRYYDKLLKAISIINFATLFSKLYRRYYDLISKFHFSCARDFQSRNFIATLCIS